MGYQFSADELRVLRQCNSESFWQRSLPLGTSLGVGTFLAAQKGIISANGRFGKFSSKDKIEEANWIL
jgi:hypothetical protein